MRQEVVEGTYWALATVAIAVKGASRASGLSKGAVYLYFKSKDAIIGALLRTLFAWELRGARNIVDGEGSATERLLAVTHMFANELDRMVVAMPILLEFYAVAFRRFAVHEHLGQMFEEFQAPLAALVRQGIERGEFRAVEPRGGGARMDRTHRRAHPALGGVSPWHRVA